MWTIISTAICVVYKFEAKAGCRLAVSKSTYLAAAFNTQTCSNANLCGAAGTAGCYGEWMKENYAHNPNDNDFLVLMDKYSSEITGRSDICPKGNYVHYCKIANGTAYYLGVDSYFADGLCTYVSCIACPGGSATTLNSVGYNTYDANRGFLYDASYSEWLYVCSDYDAITGKKLSGLYMQQVGMSCTEEKVYELFNSIGDCFFAAPAQLVEENVGLYSCVDATGAYTSAFYE